MLDEVSLDSSRFRSFLGLVKFAFGSERVHSVFCLAFSSDLTVFGSSQRVIVFCLVCDEHFIVCLFVCLFAFFISVTSFSL